MVNSILDKSINYIEKKKIDSEDLNFDATAYDVTIFDKEQTIAIGQPKYLYIEKNIVYFPIYLIQNERVISQIGLYEVFSKEILKITDEDGDIDLKKIGDPLLFSFAKELLESFDKESSKRESSERESSERESSETESSKIKSRERESSETESSKIKSRERESSETESSERESSERKSGERESSESKTSSEISTIDIIPSRSFKSESSNLWIQEYMKNENYNIIDNEGGGDCLFAAIRDALSGVGKKVTVDELRSKLAEEVTDEIFFNYKLFYDTFKKDYDEVNLTISQIKSRNNEIKSTLNVSKDRSEQLSLIKEGKLLKSDYEVNKKELLNAKNNLHEFKFMKNIENIEQFKKLITSCNFWGDTWAISTLERIYKIKTVLFSHEMWLNNDIDNVLNCGQLNDSELEDKGIFEPEYYILLDYNGNHYKLITYETKSAFKFKELPKSIINLIVNKCLEKNAGPYYLIPEFKNYKEEEKLEDFEPLLYDDDIQFQIYGMSADKLPGKGVSEKIPNEKISEFEKLSTIKNWRRKLTSIIDASEDTIKQDPEKSDILKKTGNSKLLQFNKGKSPTILTNLMETRKKLLT
jgi:hypothetical protein